MKWELLYSRKLKEPNIDKIVKILLSNRGISAGQRASFLSPRHPGKITLREFGISSLQVRTAVARIKRAKDQKEEVIVFGDYDADGVCATAIMWECLDSLGVRAMPYIPDRFSEGYGLSPEAIKRLKKENPDLGLIITVDNGIVAAPALKLARRMKIDVIVTDHHQRPKQALPAHAVVHTTAISGAGIAWVMAREIARSVKKPAPKLALAAIGTISDVLPLLEIWLE
jgi:single-stranded-DNA-specific exonuclease